LGGWVGGWVSGWASWTVLHVPGAVVADSLVVCLLPGEKREELTGPRDGDLVKGSQHPRHPSVWAVAPPPLRGARSREYVWQGCRGWGLFR